MAGTEDCASVLEQFMHDVANLPAEICHMMEEIQAKDNEMQKLINSINHKDGTLQKHIKMHSSLVPHAKEKEFAESILKNYDTCKAIQEQKIALSDKACLLLERQLKKLDVRIRELQNDGQLLDGPALPSVFNRKGQHAESIRAFPDLPMPLPLQIASPNAINMAAHRVNNQQLTSAHPSQPLPRQLPQGSIAVHPNIRSSAPATPAMGLQTQQQRQRESSAGPTDIKRRKLNPPFNANIPAQPSALRQSSLGPGTPKAGTPTGTAGSRAGSLPRTTGVTSATAAKKSSLSKKVAPHQQISKLKGKPSKHSRLSSSRKKARDSPSHRSRGTTADSDASMLSSASPSDTDSQPRSRRGASTSQPHVHSQRARAPKPPTAITSMDGPTGDRDALSSSPSNQVDADDADDDQEDDRIYCFCQQKSFGEMVACENDACAYEWFHLTCVGMKKSPDETEIWYCPKCREKPEIKVKVEMERRVKKEGGGARK